MKQAEEFFRDISFLGDVENVKGIITPRFYDYLKLEFTNGGPYRPVYDLKLEAKDAIPRTYAPFVLLSDPQIFRAADTFEFINDPDPNDFETPFQVYKVWPSDFRIPDSLSQFESFRIFRYNDVAIAEGYHHPPLPETKDYFSGGRIMDFMNQFGGWLRRGSDVILPGREGSLSYIFDVIMTGRLENQIEKRGEGTTVGKGENLTFTSPKDVTFTVTFQSNHVTPGWKFNASTTEWYIDDVNYTKRSIPWRQFKSR